MIDFNDAFVEGVVTLASAGLSKTSLTPSQQTEVVTILKGVLGLVASIFGGKK